MTNNHDGKLIHKPWGFEWSAFDNGAVAVWILHIAAKRKTSLHCHPNKKTRLIVLSGSVYFTKNNLGRNLNALDVVDIGKGEYHKTEAISELDGFPSAEDGAWLMEIEEPSNKSDLVRMGDDYGRENKPYETDVVPYTGELLKLGFEEQTFMGNKIWLESPHHSNAVWNSGIPDIRIPLGENSNFIMCIKKDNSMKVSDYVAKFISELGIRSVFGVSGGGCMHLLDSFGRLEKDINYVACHHEQAAAMAAEAYSRVHGLGCCLVTTGPGGTNALTGVACAWVDSIPVIFISGQVTTNTMIGTSGVRQFGVQETNIIELVKPITKSAEIVYSERDIRYQLEKAVDIAKSGRPGPVWIDIPLDIQSKRIDPDALQKYEPPFIFPHMSMKGRVFQTLDMVRRAQRPVMILGRGVILADAAPAAQRLVDALRIPVITSWGALEVLQYDHPQLVGHMGIFGDRASNFAVQNADLLLVIGSRLSVPMIGYQFDQFAPDAKIIMVDIDQHEMEKPSLHVDIKIPVDALQFINMMLFTEPQVHHSDDWRIRCVNWKERYPVVLPEYENTEGINSFRFIDVLSRQLISETTIVTDQGTAFTCTMQAFKNKFGQRFVVSGGHAAMGYGLPAAVGAAFGHDNPVVCIVGDGGLQMNVQELATIAHHGLPITIFVLNNNGYGTIKAMQENHFNHYVGSEEEDLTFPVLCDLANAYRIDYIMIDNSETLEERLREVLFESGPLIVEVQMQPNQPLIPRISSKKMPDGSITSSPLHDMFPFLPREELERNMKND